VSTNRNHKSSSWRLPLLYQGTFKKRQELKIKIAKKNTKNTKSPKDLLEITIFLLLWSDDGPSLGPKPVAA
jgi:hypothetical protein